MPKWHATTKKSTALQSSLIEAVMARDPMLVQQLLRRGASMSAKDPFGHTALSWAAYEGCPEIVAVMLLHSAEPCEVADDLSDALDRCDASKASWAILMLFTGSAEQETQREAFRLLKPKPFVLSAVCDYMQEHFGVDLYAVMLEGSSSGDKDTSDSSSDWSKDDSEGSPPVVLPLSKQREWHVVVYSPSVAVRREPSVRSGVLTGKKCGELIELGEYDASGTWRRAYVDIDDSRASGWVPLAHPLLGPLVLPQDAPAPRRVGRPQRETPGKQSLALAVQRRDLPAVMQLLRSGADANAEDAFGETCLFESVANSDAGVTAALLLHGADPCVRSSSSGTCVSAFAPDAGMNALLEAFDFDHPMPESSREALRGVLAILPSDVLRPTVWTLRSRGVLEEREEEAWLQADQARMDSLGPSEGSPWALRDAPASPPGREPEEGLPPRLDEAQDPFSAAEACIPTDMYEVIFRPCIVVRTKPQGGVLCRADFGHRLRLGEYDASGEWRQCEVEEGVHGWILQKHPLLGPLVRKCRDYKTEAPGRPSRGNDSTTPGQRGSVQRKARPCWTSPKGEVGLTPHRAAEASEETPSHAAAGRDGRSAWEFLTPVKPSRGKALGQPWSAWEPSSSLDAGFSGQPCGWQARTPQQSCSQEEPTVWHSQPRGSQEAPAPRRPCGQQEPTAPDGQPCSIWEVASANSPCSSQEAEKQSHPYSCRMENSPHRPGSPQQLGVDIQPSSGWGAEAPEKPSEIKRSELTHQPCSRCQAEGGAEVCSDQHAEAPNQQCSNWLAPAPQKPCFPKEDLRTPSAPLEAANCCDAAVVADAPLEPSRAAAWPAGAGAGAEEEESPLLEAVRKQEPSRAAVWPADAGAGAEEEEESPLLEAVRKQDLAEVLSCLQHGADPDTLDALGETALFEAATYGDVDITAALLLHGADPWLKSPAGHCCHQLVGDLQCETVLALFSGCEEVDPVARDEVLAALDPNLRRAIMEKLGMF